MLNYCFLSQWSNTIALLKPFSVRKKKVPFCSSGSYEWQRSKGPTTGWLLETRETMVPAASADALTFLCPNNRDMELPEWEANFSLVITSGLLCCEPGTAEQGSGGALPTSTQSLPSNKKYNPPEKAFNTWPRLDESVCLRQRRTSAGCNNGILWGKN